MSSVQALLTVSLAVVPRVWQGNGALLVVPWPAGPRTGRAGSGCPSRPASVAIAPGQQGALPAHVFTWPGLVVLRHLL